MYDHFPLYLIKTKNDNNEMIPMLFFNYQIITNVFYSP